VLSRVDISSGDVKSQSRKVLIQVMLGYVKKLIFKCLGHLPHQLIWLLEEL
jgi:hypothetical protein